MQIDKSKKISELTVEELEELIKQNLFVINTPSYVDKGVYFPPYIGDGIPPELRPYEETYIDTKTHIKKGPIQ